MNETHLIIRAAGTALVALAGLSFGNVLNASMDAWAANERFRLMPRICRKCGTRPTWPRPAPRSSWFTLRRPCPACGDRGALRYLLVSLAVALTWGVAAWQALPSFYLPGWTRISVFDALVFAAVKMILCWLLTAVAVMHAERRWLPDWFILGGAALGALFSLGRFAVYSVWRSIPLHWSMEYGFANHRQHLYDAILRWIFGILAVPAMVLLARWGYHRIRSLEGVRLREVKIVLLLAAWMGLSHTLVAFVIGLLLGAVALLVIATRQGLRTASMASVPFATFLCVGGILSGLWGRELIDMYLRWCAFV